jgi:pimeloyl-ACP methyl ester carboxylesterase
MAEPLTIGGQDVWSHDPGFWSGFFHTYNQFQIDGPLGTPRQLHVFLPRDYAVGDRTYPVLYMNDGDTLFFPGGAYSKCWNLGTLLTRLYLSQQIQRLIVVGICPLRRDYEYTHAPLWQREWGGLEDYAAYVAQGVKPFIDSHYRTQPDYSLLAGASHGGLAAFYTAAKYPDAFANVAAFSPSFWVGLDSAVEPSLLHPTDHFFGDLASSSLMFTAEPALRDRRLRIYLDWGLVREGGEHNAWIEERATARGRELRDLLVRRFGYRQGENLFVVEDPTGEHTEESWSDRLEDVLRIFFRAKVA